jgi:hypothetical protein
MTDTRIKWVHSYKQPSKPKACYESKFLGQYGLINYVDPDINWVLSRGNTKAEGRLLWLNYKALRLG